MCAHMGAPSLARVLNYWILAPLHILPHTNSSLHILPNNSKTSADIEKRPGVKSVFIFGKNSEMLGNIRRGKFHRGEKRENPKEKFFFGGKIPKGKNLEGKNLSGILS